MHRKRLRLTIAALVALSSLLFGACGGETASSADSTTTNDVTHTDASQTTTLTSDFTPPQGASGSPKGGPFGRRLLSAFSNDGLTFTRTNTLITDQANVPDLVQDSKGWIYLYYTGSNLGTVAEGTAVAISTDDAKSWVYKHVQISGAPSDNTKKPAGIGDPDVVILPDGTFRLYYTWDAPGDNDVRSKIYYAEGSDGINFAYKGVAFAGDGSEMAMDSTAFNVGQSWQMYVFTGALQTPTPNFLATSTDGKQFTLVGKQTFEQNGTPVVVSCGVAVESGYRIYGFRLDKPGGIVSFSSSDGSSWQADSGLRLALDPQSGMEQAQLKDPGVVKLTNGKWLMVYVTEIPGAQ